MSARDDELFERSIQRDFVDAFAAFKVELDQFLAGKAKNQYVYGNDVITVYARKDATHMIQGVPMRCFDIATITIPSLYQGRGFGMRVVDYIHSINPFRITYIESILNDEFYLRLCARSWKDTGSKTDRNLFKVTPLSRQQSGSTLHS